MKSSNSNIARIVAFGIAVTVGALTFGGCETGGKEGDRCNPLVLQDECNSGLHCTLVTCSVAYCCPTNGSSTDPSCANAEGCPDPDAGDAEAEGGDAEVEAAAEAGTGTDAGADADADAAEPDADAGDSGDAD